LDEEVAIMAEIFQEANDILRFQAEQTPILVLDQSHIAYASKMKIMRQVERYFGSDSKPLNGPIFAPVVGKEAKIVATAHEASGHDISR